MGRGRPVDDGLGEGWNARQASAVPPTPPTGPASLHFCFGEGLIFGRGVRGIGQTYYAYTFIQHYGGVPYNLYVLCKQYKIHQLYLNLSVLQYV